MTRVNMLHMPSRSGPLLVLALLGLAAPVVGIVAVVLPWWLLVPIFVMPIFVLIAWRLPEFALLGIIAAIFGVIPSYLLPRLPIAGGTVNAEDIGIPVLLAMLLFQNRGRLREKFSVVRAYLFPLAVFLGVASLSALFALAYNDTPVNDVLNEVRPYFTWLLLPTTLLALDGDVRLKRFLAGLLVLALVLAIGVTAQSFLGLALFEKGQEVRALYTMGGVNPDVLRSTSPGMFLMAGALVYFLAAYAKGQRHLRVFMVIATVLLCLGLLVGFGRGMWLSVIVGALLLALFSDRARYVKLVTIIVVVASAGGFAMATAKPRYAEAIVDRLFSVTEEIEHGSSFGRRKEENYFALQRAIESPLLGVGLGGRYKPDNRESLTWEAQARYIHNSYMGALVKMGIPGLFAMLWFVAVLLKRTWSSLRKSSGNAAVTYACFWIVLTSTLITSITQPNLAATNGVASISIAIVLSELLRRSYRSGATDQNAPAIGGSC